MPASSSWSTIRLLEPAAFTNGRLSAGTPVSRVFQSVSRISWNQPFAQLAGMERRNLPFRQGHFGEFGWVRFVCRLRHLAADFPNHGSKPVIGTVFRAQMAWSNSGGVVLSNRADKPTAVHTIKRPHYQVTHTIK
ncbi:hypothetical protein [Mesorhizobium sp. M0195]|uniref:hypothetical protein n=1 Tax=Mesorhizobium sp. M0195 TaxID=2956910 RepID=UPI00333A1BEE